MEYEYIIVGGGTAGCVLASRLSKRGLSVVVIEAGPEDYGEKVMTPSQTLALASTPLVKTQLTSPQVELNNGKVPYLAGSLLSGSSAVNYGNWTRTHSADYDEWAKLVGDERWNYESLLPYFKRIETHYDEQASPDVHGFEGPIHTTACDRKYPLRDEIRNAFAQAGLPELQDINTGHSLGFGPFVENWRDATRQPAGKVYDLSKATIMTDTFVRRIIIDDDGTTARGVELHDGRRINASKEVILSAGSLGTPKLLMLSGIGPRDHLENLGITVIQDLPVGHNLHDHLSSVLFWKLRHPKRGLTAGHPDFNKPEYARGNPIEWIATASVDRSDVMNKNDAETEDLLLSQPRTHVEMFAAYAPIGGAHVFKDKIGELVGTHITTPILTLLPRSRGRITLASKDPSADPVIDPCYLTEPMDREGFRTGFRIMMRAMLDTPAGQSFILEETPPPGMKRLTSAATDDEIDERQRQIGCSFYQVAGTASMGSVVDTELRVKGIERLRVVDASIFPVPLSGHYQCPMYAVAEAAADLIIANAGL